MENKIFQFIDDCLIGVDSIDEEHRKMFAMINEANSLLKDEAAPVQSAKSLIIQLRQYAATHFVNEEAYMKKINDPELERQKKEHSEFAEKVNSFDLENISEENGKEQLLELLLFLSKWLYHHILGSDILIGKIQKDVKKEDMFAFTEKYYTNIPLIDEEHSRLFEIIRETDEVIHSDFIADKYDNIMSVIGKLKEYTVVHFKDEEEYMESINYEGLDAQKMAHQAFIDKFTEIDLYTVEDKQQEYLDELIEYLLGWLSNHILKMDKKIPVK